LGKQVCLHPPGALFNATHFRLSLAGVLPSRARLCFTENQNISDDAIRTCSADTVMDFSAAAAMSDPLARLLAFRKIPPDPWWMAVTA